MLHYKCATCGKSIGTYETYYRPHPLQVKREKVHLVACSREHSDAILATYPRDDRD